MIECIEIDRWSPRSDLVREVAARLRDGELVACPTDATYGVFAAITHTQAAARLTRLRVIMSGKDPDAAERPDTPPSVIFSSFDMLSSYVVMSGTAFRVVKRLLPGPYTIILPASREVPKKLQSKRRHVGARVPDCALAMALVESLGVPVLSATAKRPDGELLSDPIEISDAFPHDIDVVIDGGYFLAEPTTVLDITEGDVEVVRQGKGPVDVL